MTSSTSLTSAGGVTGPLALVFYRVAVDHVLGQARDILGPGIALDLD